MASNLSMSVEKKTENSRLPPTAPRKSDRRMRRRRERRGSTPTDITPTASVPSTPKSRQIDGYSHQLSKEATTSPNITKNGSAMFEGEDFIPFVFSDPSDDEPGPSRRTHRTRERLRETEKKIDPEAPAGCQLAERQAVSSSDLNEVPTSDRVKEKSKMPAPERDWDRGKEAAAADRYDRRNGHGRDRKRKYEEYENGYSNRKQQAEGGSRKCPWMTGLDLNQCSNVAEMFHREVESFVDWISPSPVEDEVRGLIVTQITQIISTTFPDAQVFPFGSYQTKLYLPMGDIDLVVLSESMAYSDKSTVLHALANALKRNKITSHVTIVAKAKVPIVKFTTTYGRLKVDISINQENGLVSGQIISGFLKDMAPGVDGGESKALRSLVMITKSFLSQRSMNEVYTGGLGSYSVVCLAVSFLQMHPKIRRGEIDPERNLGVLVMEFFELYGLHFNYDEVGISLGEGGTYFNKRQRGWHAGYKKNTLSIEDPADPSNDISSGSYNFHKVRTAFAGAYGILTSTAYLRAGVLSSRQHGRAVHLRSHYEPEDLSILSTVMGITQETINHRKLAQELYDQRVLHSILGVQPLPTVIKHIQTDEEVRHKANSPSTQRKASKIVEDAWEETRQSRDFAYDESSHPRQHHRVVEEDGGRYDIGRQPPRKRRKTATVDDHHPIIFVDDEDDERSGYNDGPEDGEYESDGSDVDKYPSYSGSLRNDRRRSYWLSKGIGPGSMDDDISY